MIKRYYKKPYRIKRKKPILKNRFFWISILALIILGEISYFFIFSDFFQIKKIIVSGEEKVLTEDIKSVVENELGREILFFRTKSIFLLNLNKIRENILKKFPQIAEVEIGRGFPDTINILVVERLGLAICCQKEQCFLLDNEGVVFENAPEDSQLLKIQISLLNKKLELGDKALEKELIGKILEINDKFKDNFKIQLQEASIISEQKLNVKTAEGWEVILNPKGDLNWQMTELTAILENRIPPEKRKNLKYIDLRFDKVYIFPETYNQ